MIARLFPGRSGLPIHQLLFFGLQELTKCSPFLLVACLIQQLTKPLDILARYEILHAPFLATVNFNR
ncbi:hypothetical protein CCGE525_33450 (plasmid) [Rhizobium jaguaris]|uniref:Uncharacterized protein n=1 Tax=Rhizobium jaguaris TaxID=1312183 RepID=A0A387FWR2_9HYPH|nr:hypothetical protein CCGE525_33450 [Rhizobium jaguaris]